MFERKVIEILSNMATTAALVNIYAYADEYKDNIRHCPFYSELVGMEEVAKILEIPFEYEFNEDFTKRTAIISGNTRITIK